MIGLKLFTSPFIPFTNSILAGLVLLLHIIERGPSFELAHIFGDVLNRLSPNKRPLREYPCTWHDLCGDCGLHKGRSAEGNNCKR